MIQIIILAVYFTVSENSTLPESFDLFFLNYLLLPTGNHTNSSVQDNSSTRVVLTASCHFDECAPKFEVAYSYDSSKRRRNSHKWVHRRCKSHKNLMTLMTFTTFEFLWLLRLLWLLWLLRLITYYWIIINYMCPNDLLLNYY